MVLSRINPDWPEEALASSTIDPAGCWQSDTGAL